MSEWRRIDDLADIRRGASPRPIGDPKYFGGEVGWVRIADVTRSSRFLRETAQYVSPLGESLSVRVNPGDLVMSICGTLGRPIIIDMPACIHDGFVQFSNLRDADSSYLFYALQYAEPAFYGMGQPGTQTNLNTRLVGRYKLFVPRKDEQRRIAKILSTVDEAIEQTEALIAKYQQIQAGLMQDLFTRGVTSDGHLRPTSAQASHLYKESPLGWIPKEWEVKPLSSFAQQDITYGIVQAGPHIENGVPYIRTGDMSGDRLVREELLCTSRIIANSYKRSEVRSGEIVCAIRATVGKVLRVPSDLDGANLTQGTARIAPNSKTDPTFLLWAIRSERTQRAISLSIKGTTFNEITLGELRRLPVAAPIEVSEQQLIGNRMGECDKVLEAESMGHTKLCQQKHGLMQDLLTGRVRVKVGEAASV